MKHIKVVCLFGALLATLANCQQSIQEPTDGLNKNLLPTVQVDRNNPNKSRVGVHVPLFFNMNNEKDDESGRSRLDLNVMGGLVTVNRDRERKPDGASSGPLTVTVFGIPVYTGNVLKLRDNYTQDLVQAQSRSLGSTLNNALTDQVATSEQLLSTIRRNSERMTQHLGDMLSRMASLVRPQAESIDYSANEKQVQRPQASAPVGDNQQKDALRVTRSDGLLGRGHALSEKSEPLHENLDSHV